MMPGATRYLVTIFVICPHSRTIDYDYAIIKLLHPVTFSASVAPVCLPPPLQQGQDQPSLEGGSLWQYC